MFKRSRTFVLFTSYFANIVDDGEVRGIALIGAKASIFVFSRPIVTMCLMCLCVVWSLVFQCSAFLLSLLYFPGALHAFFIRSLAHGLVIKVFLIFDNMLVLNLERVF